MRIPGTCLAADDTGKTRARATRPPPRRENNAMAPRKQYPVEWECCRMPAKTAASGIISLRGPEPITHRCLIYRVEKETRERRSIRALFFVPRARNRRSEDSLKFRPQCATRRKDTMERTGRRARVRVSQYERDTSFVFRARNALKAGLSRYL